MNTYSVILLVVCRSLGGPLCLPLGHMLSKQWDLGSAGASSPPVRPLLPSAWSQHSRSLNSQKEDTLVSPSVTQMN